MLIVGLTGGIATGKTTVANMLRGLGAHIIDLDEISHRIMAPGSDAAREIERVFGKGVIKSDGSVDRGALGEIVFSDPEARKALEDIVHPKVWEEERRIIDCIAHKDPHCIVVVDVPLLMELNLEHLFDEVIVVYAPRRVQKERLMERNGFTEQQAEARLRAQMDIEEKRLRAKWIVDNSGALEKTEEQIRKIWCVLRACVKDKENHGGGPPGSPFRASGSLPQGSNQ